MAHPPADGTVLAKGLTAGDYLVRTWPPGVKVQLVEGAAIADVPGEVHREVAGRVFATLVTFTGAGPGRGVAGLPTAVVVSANDVYLPDAWWVRDGRPDVAHGRLDSVPDLAVEVRSPATWRYDSGPKRRRYGAAGTAELWLVDPPARKVTVHRRSSADSTSFDATFAVTVGELLVTPLLPGFSLDIEELFRP